MALDPQSISALLSDPNTAPYLGGAMGLLGSSGASRLPVTMGAAMGNALSGSQQYSQQVLQNALQKIMLPYQQARVAEILRQAGMMPNSTPGVQQQQQINANPAAQTHQALTNDAQNTPGASPGIVGNSADPNAPGAPQLPPGEAALLADPNYQDASRAAMFNLGGAQQRMTALAQAHLQYAPVRRLTPQETAQYIPGGLPPGFFAQIDTATGKVTVSGQSPYKSLPGYDANGMPITTLVDTRGHSATIPSIIAPPPGAHPGSGNLLLSTSPGGALQIPGTANAAAPGGVPQPRFSGGNISSPVPASITTNMDAMARGIANYSIRPSTYMLRSAAGQIIMGKVMQYNPNYDQKQYEVAQQTLKAFADGTQGLNVKSFNVALQHLDVLNNLASGLQNNDPRSINYLKNMAKKQLGKSAPTAFDAAKQLVADEIQKAVAGVPGGEAERSELMDNVSSASSPEQLQGVINTFEHLMAGQLSGLQQEYQAGTQRNDFTTRYLTPQSRQMLAKFGNSEGASGARAAPSQTAPPAAVAYLQTHPELRAAFKAKYGYLPQ